MFEKIEMLLRDIEGSVEEINIMLGIAKISFLDYVLIKRGEISPPESLGAWSLQSIDQEVGNLKESIEKLNKIKDEVLSFNK